MKNIKLTIEYDGKEWGGWQKQPNKPNISGAEERGRKEGERIGQERGEKIGMKREKIETAKRMLNKKIDMALTAIQSEETQHYVKTLRGKGNDQYKDR